MASTSDQAAIAAHRFGLGEPELAALQADPAGWLRAQIGPGDAARGDNLLDTAFALKEVEALRERRRMARATAPASAAASSAAVPRDNAVRDIDLADGRSRLLTAITTARPFAERLTRFWANHFTVSLAKGSCEGLCGAFERDAIRPHIAGNFEQLLFAATTHPAMLRYLDNDQSAGPNSRAAKRRAQRPPSSADDRPAPRLGINENLARELLELHTLGATSSNAEYGYTQADVTALAAVLSGWRVTSQMPDWRRPFDAAWHEPGSKTILGKTYREGHDALRQVLHDLAHHPATARFIATKLARHFSSDDPPPALVDRLALAYLRSTGELGAVYQALIESPETWAPEAAKLKTPEEFIVSSARLLGLSVEATANASTALGQRVQAPPSPAGWSDRAEDWLGPDAVWKRVEWATRTAASAGQRIDARALAQQSFGDALGATTATQLARAADGAQAVALLLMSPEFQRR